MEDQSWYRVGAALALFGVFYHAKKMRHTRTHYRVMHRDCPQPKRTKSRSMGPGAAWVIPMRPEHGSRLKDGSTLWGHDDFHCLQDFEAVKYFQPIANGDGIQPGVTLHLSEKGKWVVSLLRAHKCAGGSFKSFIMPFEPLAQL